MPLTIAGGFTAGRKTAGAFRAAEPPTNVDPPRHPDPRRSAPRRIGVDPSKSRPERI